MKFFVAFIAIATIAVQLASGIDREAAKENIHNYRINSQNFHVDKLVEEVEKLEEAYSKLGDIPDKQAIKELKARVLHLEDDDCDADHVQCGGDVPECISPLFVCDGHKDCKNGRDEDEEICSDEPYKVGSSLSGITSWTDCVTHSPHMTVISITANHKPAAYTTRTYVKAVVSFEVDEHSHLVQSFSAKGYWNPAKRALVLVPDSNEQSVYGHGVICKFTRGNNREADCRIGTVGSMHTCATFRGSRV